MAVCHPRPQAFSVLRPVYSHQRLFTKSMEPLASAVQTSPGSASTTRRVDLHASSVTAEVCETRDSLSRARTVSLVWPQQSLATHRNPRLELAMPTIRDERLVDAFV